MQPRQIQTEKIRNSNVQKIKWQEKQETVNEKVEIKNIKKRMTSLEKVIDSFQKKIVYFEEREQLNKRIANDLIAYNEVSKNLCIKLLNQLKK